MSKKNVRYIIFLLVIIFILFLCSVFFIVLVKDHNDKKIAPVDPEDVSLVADSNTIIMKNIISVSDDFGRNIYEDNAGAFGYLEFDIKNNTNVDRDFTKLESPVKEINPNYITFYLTNYANVAFDEFTGNKLPSYDDFHYLEDKADSKRIHEGSLAPNEEKHFILRTWIAENYVVDNTEESFSFEIHARAV